MEGMDINVLIWLLIFLQLIAAYGFVFVVYYQIQLIEKFSKYLKKEKRRRKSNNGRK